MAGKRDSESAKHLNVLDVMLLIYTGVLRHS